ncbi:MAG TPA: glycosyltransferase family 2 protein [Verrucomicrobiae bacterium]|nr:glycosyltransferase family 2 protein [Verrucomicrobiae bacterium]
MIPISVVIPTKDRAASLSRTLASLLAQAPLPAEIVIVDASSDEQTRTMMDQLCQQSASGATDLRWIRARSVGAASQRNEGIAMARHAFMLFCDDDITLEPLCVQRLWAALSADEKLGGVSATVTNQVYGRPGRFSRLLFTILHGRSEASFAGRVIGPALNLLPDDNPELPEIVATEWLNTGCTLYRREALPVPPFDPLFTGYSLMEDLTMSLRVAQRWQIANARLARIYHDSQPGEHKSNVRALAKMEFVNRYYVMTRILGRHRLTDHLRFALLELFHVANQLRSIAGVRSLPAFLCGKVAGVRTLKALPRIGGAV